MTVYPPLKYKCLVDDAVAPEPQFTGDAGFDLHANRVIADDLDIMKRMFAATGKVSFKEDFRRIAFGTGIAIEIPFGYVGLVCSRSGLACKQGLIVANQPGVVDSGYRGEIIVCLMALPMDPDSEPVQSDTYRLIKKNDRIAQLLVVPDSHGAVIKVKDFTSSDRGTGGFGSTGK